jgi:hypothetical protein
MKQQLAGLFLVSVLGVTHAQAESEVYLCVNEKGDKEYKNTGATKGCKRLDLPGITTVPAPSVRRAPATSASAAPKASSSPADFPRVDNGQQKARDNERRQILMDELKAEEQKLAGLKQEYNNGEPERRGDERNYAKYQERVAVMKEDISRTEKNIEALRREVNNLK